MNQVSFKKEGDKYSILCSGCGAEIVKHAQLSDFQLKNLKDNPELLVPSYCKKCIYEYK
jgi:hypothetical protein